jgi:hypothetical protein
MPLPPAEVTARRVAECIDGTLELSAGGAVLRLRKSPG